MPAALPIEIVAGGPGTGVVGLDVVLEDRFGSDHGLVAAPGTGLDGIPIGRRPGRRTVAVAPARATQAAARHGLVERERADE